MSIYNSYVAGPQVVGGPTVLNGSHIVRTGLPAPVVTVPTVQPRIASPIVYTSAVGVRPAPVVAQPVTTAVVADSGYFTNAFKAVFMIGIPLGFLFWQWE